MLTLFIFFFINSCNPVNFLRKVFLKLNFSESGFHLAYGFAVDFITGNVYITENIYNDISVCSKNGSFCKILVKKDVQDPRVIALHPRKGKMYWTEFGQNPKISVASMDGSSHKPLITDLRKPNGLTVDWNSDRLYWTNGKFEGSDGSIESCRLDGSDRKLFVTNVAMNPYYIAIFQDILFCSDLMLQSISSFDKVTGKYRKSIVTDSERIHGLYMYDPSVQNFDVNPCESDPCSHFCLLNDNSTYTCACPRYYILAANKHICIPVDEMDPILFYASEKNIQAIRLKPDSSNYYPYIIADELNLAMDVGFYNDTVYWTDFARPSKRIQRIKQGEDRINVISRNCYRFIFHFNCYFFIPESVWNPDTTYT